MWRGAVCTRLNLITGCIRDKALRSTIAHLPAVTCSNHSSDKLINQNKFYLHIHGYIQKLSDLSVHLPFYSLKSRSKY